MSGLGSCPDEVAHELASQRADLAALADDVQDLSDAVSNVADQLIRAGAIGVGGSGGLGRAPWCWRGVDEETAEEMSRELVEWVAWLRGRYPIAELLPACWRQHPELVEELTVLRAAWAAAYLDPGAHPSSACDFHDRWLPGVLARVRTWGVHCGTEHRDRADCVYDSQPT